jgi:hypothetical protein
VDTSGDGKYTNGEPVNIAGIRNRIRASSQVPLDFSNTTLMPDTNINAVATTGKACEGTGTDPVTGTTISNGVRVTVEYDYPIIMPLLGGIIGSQTIHLRAVVTDTILEPRCP